MTGSTIKYSEFESVGSIVDNIISKQAEPKKCEFCGKEYLETEIDVLGRKSIVFCVPCDCLDKEQKKKEEAAAKERLREKFQKANIGKRYIGMTLEKLEKMGTEHIADAYDFIENFNPESGNSIHMIGIFGNGKTSVGYATVSALLKKGFNCVALTWSDIVSRCYNAKNFNTTETLEGILNGLSHFDLVMLDEFVVNIKDDKEINLATELFDRWYKDNKCFLLINNPCDIQDLRTVPRLGKLLDRVREQADKWVFEHKSYRQQD